MSSARKSGKVNGGKCPLCGKATDHAVRPFCSKHCADVDLGRWLNGNYAIPVEDEPDEDSFPEDGAGARVGPTRH
jgi:endogenous inhibitor of DNA gyrase (YacG/DUF329 family)